MMRPPVRVIAPASLPVTSEELRRYCRIDGDGEDEHLERLAKSAVARLDGYAGYLGRAIINQTWRQDFDALPHSMAPKMRLKLPDISEARVILIDGQGAEVPQAEDRFVIRRDFIGWYVVSASGIAWPSGIGAVEYVAGYGAGPDDVDNAVREAIGMMVQSAYSLTASEATLRVETIEGASSQGYFGPEIMRNAVTAHVKDLLQHARWRPV